MTHSAQPKVDEATLGAGLPALLGACSDSSEVHSVESVMRKREVIKRVAEEMKQMAQIDCPVTHRFTDGLYLREIFMPAGSVVIGKIHATRHFNIILSGECIVATVEGVQHIRGPYTFESEPGVQKCVINITNVRWQTTHVTAKTDLEEIEKDLIVADYDQLQVDAIMKELEG